jgi:4-hydroxy-3-methylbut-2-enyl diphosphate reductase
MKKFEIPEQFKSSFTGQIKQWRKSQDPRKKDFAPSVIPVGDVTFVFPRHMGFCYGVENAIEIAFKAVSENPGKRVFLLGEMIHNPAVNEDLKALGVTFIMDTAGNHLMDWNTLTSEDIVITPAFGTTLEIEAQLSALGVDVKKYNTTCPFVEKVWKRSNEIGQEGYTIVIHGKYKHEETRATFSHANVKTKSVIVRDMREAAILAAYIRGEKDAASFSIDFAGKCTEGFDPHVDLSRIGVVNQTTMLATETEEIAQYLKQEVTAVRGPQGFAETRDTLCYATNDNQDAAMELLNSGGDVAFVIGGHNSSNTYQLATILSQKITTFFIEDADAISEEAISFLQLKSMQVESQLADWKNWNRVVLASGASCPDTLVDQVVQKVLSVKNIDVTPQLALQQWMSHE